jgi:dihydroorotase
MSSSTSDLMVAGEEDLARIFASGVSFISVHAEDDARIQARRHIAEEARDVSVHGAWRDAESALLATARVVRLARAAGRKVHILHVSTSQELELIAANRDWATCEALPQHLTFHAPDCYALLGARAQQNPPIREAFHQRALWRAVASGVVDVIASDHGPHALADKAAPYPNMAAGMPGTQTLLPIMLSYVTQGRLSLMRLADLLCHAPARLFGVQGKGRIAIGADADFTIVDLKKEQTIANEQIASKVGWTAYDGMRIVGWPVGTIVRGQTVMWQGSLIGSPCGRPVVFDRASAAR